MCWRSPSQTWSLFWGQMLPGLCVCCSRPNLTISPRFVSKVILPNCQVRHTALCSIFFFFFWLCLVNVECVNIHIHSLWGETEISSSQEQLVWGVHNASFGPIQDYYYVYMVRWSRMDRKIKKELTKGPAIKGGTLTMHVHLKKGNDKLL